MENILNYLINIADILLVASFIYLLINLAKRTKTIQIIWGLALIILAYFLTDALSLYTTTFLFEKFFYVVPFVLALLFYPDIKKMLEDIGNLTPVKNSVHNATNSLAVTIVETAVQLSKLKTGALIVFERNNPLDDYIANGIEFRSEVNTELLRSIFYEGTPLHDGALIIRENQIVAAACTLPLTANKNFYNQIHTRHKAAIGLSEITDALVLVVSEESGIISVALNGSLNRHLNKDTLFDILDKELVKEENKTPESKFSFRHFSDRLK
ncbi:MAG: diadenylate cyclase CdaA [Armatimonadetes bacterium]|nr:diadenylate cyclase CdaA [Candidatus Hippobium faecium]